MPVHLRQRKQFSVERSRFSTVKTWFCCAFSGVASVFLSTTLVFADGFTGEEFQAWPDEAKTSFVEVSVTMASMVAGQTNQRIGRCYSDWYFKEEGLKAARRAEILTAINGFPTYHPSATLLAVLGRNCGNVE